MTDRLWFPITLIALALITAVSITAITIVNVDRWPSAATAGAAFVVVVLVADAAVMAVGTRRTARRKPPA